MVQIKNLGKIYYFCSMMNFPFYAARHISVRGTGHRQTPAMRVAITAVALCIIVMLATIGIVSGFKKEIRSKVLGFNPHFTITSPATPQTSNIIELTPVLKSLLDSIPYIKEYTPQIAMPAILKTQSDFKGTYLHGLCQSNLAEFLGDNLTEGRLPTISENPDSIKYEVLISDLTARQLGLKAGDRINTYFMNDGIRVRSFTITGIFNTHFDDYDNLNIYAPLPTVRKIANLGKDQVTSLSIYTDNTNNPDVYYGNLSSAMITAYADGYLSSPVQITSVMTQGAIYFQWLDILDMNVIVILVLMTAVACATIISGMLIIILNKKRLIGILRALGTSRRQIRKIFVYLALKIAGVGLLIGNCIAIPLLLIQQYRHIIPLDPESYYIDYVPVSLNVGSILILNIAIFLLIYMSLLIPSAFAARISPAETMRYE